MTAQIALHELRVLMRSPFAWLAAGLLQLLFGCLFLSAVERFIENQTATTQVISASVSQAASSAGLSSYLIVHFLAPVSIVFIFATPLLCMHLIAGDRQSNRFNFLLSLPVSARQIVVGKFIGATTFQCLIIATGAVLLAMLSFNIRLDTTHFLTAGLGLMLFVAAATALTLFFSSVSNRPVLAAFFSFVTMTMLWMAAATSSSDVLQFVSPSAHLHSFMQGLLDSRDVIYYLAAICILLTLGVWRFDAQRVRGFVI